MDLLIPWERFLLSLMVGGILSLAGSLSQWMTENELASPSTLGVDAISVFIVLLSQMSLWFFPEIFEQLTIVSSMAGLIVVFIMWFFPWIKLQSHYRQFSTQRSLILVGLSLNLCIGSFFALMHFLSLGFGLAFPTELWFGQMHTPSSHHYFEMLPYVLLLIFIYLKIFPKVFIFHLGRGAARSFHLPLWKTYRLSVIFIFLSTHLVIHQFGVFSFMGLILPIIWRQLNFSHPIKREMIWGPIFSGLLFSFFDLACYFGTIQGVEVPVGLVSAIFGSFALLYLTWRRFYSSHATLGK